MPRTWAAVPSVVLLSRSTTARVEKSTSAWSPIEHRQGRMRSASSFTGMATTTSAGVASGAPNRSERVGKMERAVTVIYRFASQAASKWRGRRSA